MNKKKIELYPSTATKSDVLNYNGLVLDEYCTYCTIKEELENDTFEVELDLSLPKIGSDIEVIEELVTKTKEYAVTQNIITNIDLLKQPNNYEGSIRLNEGIELQVLEEGSEWTKVYYHSTEWYIDNVNLTNHRTVEESNKIGERTFAYTNSEYSINRYDSSLTQSGSFSPSTRVELLESDKTGYHKVKENDTEYYIKETEIITISLGTVTFVTTLTEIKVYSSKDNSTTSIFTIPQNTKINLLEEDGNWVKIKYNDTVGYVEKILIQGTYTKTFGTVVRTQGVDFCNEPNIIDATGVVIPPNTVVEILETITNQQGDWAKTIYDEKTGYVRIATKGGTKYISDIREETVNDEVKQLSEKTTEEITQELSINTLNDTRETEDIIETTTYRYATTTIKVWRVSVFASPDASSSVITTLEPNIKIEITSKPNTEFSGIKYGNIIGYVENNKLTNFTTETEHEIVIIGNNKDEIRTQLTLDSILKIRDEYGYEIFRITNIVGGDNTQSVYGRQITQEECLRLWIDDSRPTNITGQMAIEKLYVDSVGRRKELVITSDIATNNTAYYVRKTLNECIFDDDNAFIKTWGGEVERRRYELSILKRRGSDRGVVFRRGKNYSGIEEDVNLDELVTRIIPIGFDGITLDEKYIDSPKINNYANIYPREIKFEEVRWADSPNNQDKTGFATLEEAQAELKRTAEEYFINTNIDEIKASYTIKVVDVSKTEEYKNLSIFETTWIGDDVSVIDEKLGIDFKARITSRKYDVIQGRRTETTVSNVVKEQSSITLESLQNQINNIQVPDMPNIQDILAQAKKEAEDMIRNGVTESYVVLKENEILIMDTPDVNTAINLLRMNKNGIAGSTTGYNGPFDLAMTIDGQIVADRVSTGTLNAGIIRAGVLMSANTKSWINMENGTFNFYDKISYDGSTFRVEFNSTDLNEIFEQNKQDIIDGINADLGETYVTKTELQVSNDGIMQSVAGIYITNDSASEAFSNLDTNLQTNYATKTLVNQTADSITQTVSKKVGKDEIISSINQTAEEIKIAASKISLDGYVFVSTQLTAPHITGKVQQYMEEGSVFSSDGEMNVKNFYAMPGGTFNVESTATFTNQIYGKSTGVFDGNLTCNSKLISDTGSITKNFSVGALLTAQNFTLANNANIGGTCYCNSQEVTYDSNVGRNLVVTNNTSTKTLSVTGKSTLNAISTTTITNTGNATVNGTLTTQNQTINNNLTVSKRIYANAGEITTSLEVGGALTAGGTATISGYTSIENSLGVDNYIYCGGNIECLSGDINASYLGSTGNIACQGSISGSSLSISGSKNCVQETENFGKRLVNAYETADYYFGDIGESQTIDGETIIWIDDVFKEIISTERDYQVFLTKYGRGDIWVEERTQDYFVVKSENDISFGWEIKGKRKGYENNRLEEHTEVYKGVVSENE